MISILLVAMLGAEPAPPGTSPGAGSSAQTAAGILLGGAVGAASGAAIALGSGVVVAQLEAERCRTTGPCSDALDGPMTILRVGAFSIPIGLFAGAIVGGMLASP